MTSKFDDYTAVSASQFSQVQADMVKNWREDLERRGVDFEAYATARRAAYDRRWREALNHTHSGSRILDVGGGYLHPSLLELITSQKHEYHETDIDAAVVAGNKRLAKDYDIPEARFTVGENTRLEYPDGTFDLVFSSHCLEHSRDIRMTLSEIRRVLKPTGKLFFAVPMGWDTGIEHIYFLTADDWLALVRDCGFTIHGTLFGDFYPESGHDFAAIATPDGAVANTVDVDTFRKARYVFKPWSDPCIRLGGRWDPRGDHVVGVSPGADLRWEGTSDEVLLLVASDASAGTVEITNSRSGRSVVDLASWFPIRRVLKCYPLPDTGRVPARDESLGNALVSMLRRPGSSIRRVLDRLGGNDSNDWIRIELIHGKSIVVYGILVRE